MVARGKFGDSNCQALDFIGYRGACPQKYIWGQILGTDPVRPLILLAIAGPVPKNTFSNSNSELQLLTPKIPIDG